MSGAGAFGPQDTDNEVARLLSLLWRRRVQIVLVTLLVTLAVTAVVTRLPDSYRAESVLLFAAASTSPDPTGDGTRNGQPGDMRHLASEIERIRSRRLLLRVVQEADLLHDPAFNPALARGPGPLERLGLRAPPAPEALRLSRQRTATLATLRARLKVRPIGQSRALSVAVTAPDPESAARVANLIAEVYLDGARDRARHDRAIATDWLDRRVAELRQRLQAAEAAVADFRIGSGLAERGPQSAAMQERIGELTRALAQAQVEAAAARARAERFSALPPEAALAHADADAPRQTGSQLIQDLRRQEADLKRTRAQLALRYGPRHPRLREANADLLDLRLLINDETARIAQRLRQEAALAQDRADALQTELRKVNAATGALGRAEVKLGQLEREAAAERALFDTFLARLKETRVTAGSPDRRAELITRAHPPDRPTAPNRPLLAGFGAMTAVAVAVALALLREALDRGVRTPEQLERLTGLRVLASVPRVRRAPARRVLPGPPVRWRKRCAACTPPCCWPTWTGRRARFW